MRIAVSSDLQTELTDALLAELKARGHEIHCIGALDDTSSTTDWPVVSSMAARAVALGNAEEAIVCCWSGTDAAIAANKINGVRAALVDDPETGRLARVYNHANVLALSLRKVSIPLMKEILDAWFATPTTAAGGQTEWNLRQIERVRKIEAGESLDD